ncbi:MAG: squalene synthase HpnC [Methylophagaceae bacterium]|jgi:squalene synthase HpnC
MTRQANLNAAYHYCQQLAQSHYENFPVASFLLPAHLRQAISVIYAFARTADDIADEGDADTQQRLDELAYYEHQLSLIEQQHYQEDAPIFVALNDVIKRYHLPIVLFRDLLSAFSQDLLQKRYPDDAAIDDYCRRSANPIGRLLLHLNGKPNELDLIQSDALCTALQLINFYQDIQQDLLRRDRIYIPQQDFENLGITETALFEVDSTKVAPILREKYRKIHTLLSEGFLVGFHLHGRFGWEIRTITLAGILTLKQLSSQKNQALYSRPRLTRYQLLGQSGLALSPSLYRFYCQSYLENKLIS